MLDIRGYYVVSISQSVLIFNFSLSRQLAWLWMTKRLWRWLNEGVGEEHATGPYENSPDHGRSLANWGMEVYEPIVHDLGTADATGQHKLSGGEGGIRTHGTQRAHCSSSAAH
jgi:hypothetical protein